MGHYYILKEDKEGGGGNFVASLGYPFTPSLHLFFTPYMYIHSKKVDLCNFLWIIFFKEGATMERL